MFNGVGNLNFEKRYFLPLQVIYITYLILCDCMRIQSKKETLEPPPGLIITTIFLWTSESSYELLLFLLFHWQGKYFFIIKYLFEWYTISSLRQYTLSAGLEGRLYQGILKFEILKILPKFDQLNIGFLHVFTCKTEQWTKYVVTSHGFRYTSQLKRAWFF